METLNRKTPHPFAAVTPEIANTMDRESLINWLCWNDPNGVYRDAESIKEFGNVLSLQDALHLVVTQINEQ